MSHEVEQMVSAREIPWHMPFGTNTVITENVMTAKEALVLGGLDWNVTPQPVFTFIAPDDQYQIVAGLKAMVRDLDHSVLGTVSDRYVPVQNHEAFSFFDAVVGDGDAKYETAGSLRKGRLVFLTAKLPRELLIGGVDHVELYLLLTTSHDGTRALQCGTTPVRVVCKNTMNLAHQGAGMVSGFSFTHQGDLHGQMARARETIGLANQYADRFEEQMNELIETTFTKVDFEQMMRAAFPDKANRDSRFSQEQYGMIGVFESSPTIDDSFRYTSWGALNAVREWDDWGRTIRVGKDKTEGEVRTENAWFGKNVANANKALDYLVEA